MRGAWVVALLVTACGRLDFQAVPATSPPASCAATPCSSDALCATDQLCHPIVFADNFDSGEIDPVWNLMRFDFDVEGGHLQTLPTVRTGFNYGQGGNGRSAVAALHIGDPTWTDLRVEWTQQSQASLLIVDGSLPPCQHTPSVMFRVQSYAESWNAPENTNYGFTIDQGVCGGPLGPQGTWGAGATFHYWIPGQGYSPTHDGDSASLGNGVATITDTPLRYVLELRGTSAQLWIDGALVYAFDDATFAYPPGDAPLLWGGVAFTSAWEQMFWIDDVAIADLTN